MVLPRTSILSRGLGRAALRSTRSTTRSQGWKQIGRRTYASGHGEQQSSELPWIIGSIAVTVPAAGWLLQQGPTKSDHGHEAHGKEHKDEDGEVESSEEKPDEDQPAEEPKDDEQKDDDKDEKDGTNEKDGKDEKDDKPEKEEKDEEKDEDSADEGKDDYPPPSSGSPGQINWKPGMSKGPGEGQKGERAPSEKKGEKDAQGSKSGAKHPYIDDAEKSKKGAGITETAKIHGTVDSRQPAR